MSDDTFDQQAQAEVTGYALPSAELARFRAGDEAYWRWLVRRYTPLLTHICGWYRVSSLDVEDLVQEAWVLAFQTRERYGGRGTVEAWLRGLCRNSCRRLARDKVRFAGAGGDEVDPDSLPTRGTDDSPLERVARSEARDRLKQALAVLTYRQRRVLLLRYVKGWPVKEVAAEMGCSEGTVKATCTQARRKLVESGVLSVYAPER